ncbi:MAG TPA: HemK2/MTQ2 family protein methyltransferase [Solirubrobacter sp.]|nr:HemK2/MTQ2 family protein methyltransferase [Solirubrobacter sp.]
MRRIVLPGVFRPRSDTWLLARAACGQPLRAGASVLELCAGPGLAGVAAARRHRAALTTVDVSRRAALNARLNGALNGVRVRALRGDLVAPLDGARFDLIVANPPYVPGPPPPRHGAARATDAGADGRALLDRICREAPRHLAPGGVLLVVHSEVSGVGATVDALTRGGLRTDVVLRARGPLGPVLRARRRALEARGRLRPGQRTEELVVVRGQSSEGSRGCRRP